MIVWVRHLSQMLRKRHNMGKIIALLVALGLLGCASGESAEPMFLVPGGNTPWSELPPEMTEPTEVIDISDGSELGQARQAIVMNTGYGHECSGDGQGCSPPWQGGDCCVPDKRKVWFNFIQSTCPTTNDTRAAVAAALTAARDILVAQGWESSYGTSASAKAGFTNVRCGDAGAGGAGGVFSPEGGLGGWLGADLHTTPNGRLIQYAIGGNIYVDVAEFANVYIWQFGVTTQRFNIIYNVTLHEAMHAAGLGHTPNTLSVTGQKLLNYGFRTDVHTNASNGLLYPSSTQLSMLDCYNETSGTNPNC